MVVPQKGSLFVSPALFVGGRPKNGFLAPERSFWPPFSPPHQNWSFSEGAVAQCFWGSVRDIEENLDSSIENTHPSLFPPGPLSHSPSAQWIQVTGLSRGDASAYSGTVRGADAECRGVVRLLGGGAAWGFYGVGLFRVCACSFCGGGGGGKGGERGGRVEGELISFCWSFHCLGRGGQVGSKGLV